MPYTFSEVASTPLPSVPLLGLTSMPAPLLTTGPCWSTVSETAVFPLRPSASVADTVKDAAALGRLCT